MGYRQEYWRSLGDPEDFWREQAEAVSWIRKPKRILDATSGAALPLVPDATLNTCYNALDRHVIPAGPTQPALIFHSAITGDAAHLQLRRAAGRGGAARRRAARARRAARRPGGDLPADGAGGGDRHAGLRPDRRRALGGVRRLRPGRAGRADRRRPTQGDHLRLLRAGGGQGDRVQAAARRRPGPDRATSPTTASSSSGRS